MASLNTNSILNAIQGSSTITSGSGGGGGTSDIPLILYFKTPETIPTLDTLITFRQIVGGNSTIILPGKYKVLLSLNIITPLSPNEEIDCYIQLAGSNNYMGQIYNSTNPFIVGAVNTHVTFTITDYIEVGLTDGYAIQVWCKTRTGSYTNVNANILLTLETIRTA